MLDLNNSKFYSAPKFGSYKVTLLTDSEDLTLNKANLTVLVKGFGLYNKKSPVGKPASTQNVARFRIAEGDNKGQIITSYPSDMDIGGDFGLLAHAVSEFGKPSMSTEDVLKEMVKTPFTLVFHQEYSEDSDRLFPKWGVRKTPSSVADDATLESIHAEQLAKKQREDAERTMLNSIEPVDNGEL